jgi:hypothetical protein
MVLSLDLHSNPLQVSTPLLSMPIQIHIPTLIITVYLLTNQVLAMEPRVNHTDMPLPLTKC